jgi:hypothetical protein
MHIVEVAGALMFRLIDLSIRHGVLRDLRDLIRFQEAFLGIFVVPLAARFPFAFTQARSMR